MTRKVVRLSGILAVAMALPVESVTTLSRKKAVVRNCERSRSACPAPPPPPGERSPFIPSGTCGATVVRLLASRRPRPRAA